MSKKIISLALVIVTIFSVFTLSANAASYSTGNYTIAASNGSNIRTGAGTGYSKVGAATKGTTFYVSKVSGNWGYTSSIKATNGVRSGWVCLDYATFKPSHTHNYNGGRYYQSAHPHEISVRCTSYSSCGGWKWTGENYKVSGCEQCYPSVKYTLSYNANGGSGAPGSQRVKANTAFKLSSTKPTRSGYTFLGWSTSKSATSASYNPGHSVSIKGNVTLYAVWKKNSTVTNVSYYAEITANSGLILRSGAGTSYTALTTIPKGYVVQVTQENNGWGKTTYNSKTGWICLSYTKKVNYSNTVKVKLNVPLYKQTDSRWSSVKIGTKTIGNVGCLITSIAMTYSYNSGKTVYPNTVRNTLSFDNNSLYWSSLSKVNLTSVSYNSSMTNSIMSTIYSKLRQGKPVIIGAQSSSGSYQHWVVITGYTGTSTTSFSTANFTINDPGTQSCTTLKAFLANGSNADRTKIIRIVY